MNWRDVLARLNESNSKLAGVFNAVYEEAQRDGSDQFGFNIEDYRFGSTILHGGRAFASDQRPLSSEFLMPNGLPFGIILDNGCEVFDWLMSERPLPPRSQAVLKQGSCIGLFEMLDDFTEGSQGVSPDWNIVAGAASLTFISSITTRQVRQRLARAFGSFDTALFDYERTTAKKLMSIPGFQHACSDWRAKILYLSPEWFRYIFSHETEACLAARLFLYELGWRYGSKVRDTRTRLFHYFTPQAGETEGDYRLVELSLTFLRYVSDILNDRRPVFLFEDTASELGPIPLIRQSVLPHLREGETKVLLPCYLSQARDNGFIPLDHISPRIVTGQRAVGGLGANTMENIMMIFQKIRNASNNVLKEDRSTGHMLLDLNQWICRLAFRTPMPKSEEFGGERTGFKLSVNMEGNRRIEREMMFDQDFFAPHFDKPPMKNSEFFRNCLKIDNA